MRPALHLRTPNPHLGVYFAIITSAFISLAVLLALLEQIGWHEPALAALLILAPIALYLVIAVATRSRNEEDYFTCGRRVPAIYSGFVLAATLIGGVGVFAYTGAVFFLGFDALAIGLGWTFGMLAGTVLFMPYLRKAGAYTVASFLAHRFASKPTRLLAGLLLLLPVALLLAAELKIGALVTSVFLPIGYKTAVLAFVCLLSAIAVLGGMRALTWSGSAQFLIGAVAFTAPLVIISVILTSLPVPQLTYGEEFAPLHRAEVAAGMLPQEPERLSAPLPQSGPAMGLKPFAQSFGMVGPFDFILLFVIVALGSAALPSLLIRSGVTMTVSGQRWSGAWAVLFVAVFAMTVPAAAIFARILMLDSLAHTASGSLPHWMNALAAHHLLVLPTGGGSTLQASQLQLSRNAILLGLPMAAGLPIIGTLLLAAGGIAIALAAAGTHLFTLGTGLAEDLFRPITGGLQLPRQMAVWAAIGLVAFGAAIFLAMTNIPLLRAVVAALALIGATFFPVLLLAVWWDRFTSLGAIAAMATGFGVMVIGFALQGTLETNNATGLTTLAGVVGALLSTAAGVGLSLWDRPPSVGDQRYFDALHDPEGEAIYDEARRQLAESSA